MQRFLLTACFTLLLACSGEVESAARPDPTKPVLVYANHFSASLESLKLQAAQVSDDTGWDVRAVVACGRCDPNQLVLVPADEAEEDVEPAAHLRDCSVLRLARAQDPFVVAPLERFLGPNRPHTFQ